jgi:hypothetical protein
MSFDFLPNYVEIMALTNQGVLLCHAYHGLCYYMGNPTTKQWQKILNLKTRYDIIKLSMMVERSKPLCYKIMRFLKPSSARMIKNSICTIALELSCLTQRLGGESCWMR